MSSSCSPWLEVPVEPVGFVSILPFWTILDNFAFWVGSEKCPKNGVLFFGTQCKIQMGKGAQNLFWPIPHVCPFSPQTEFLVQFFSTQKRVNHDQIDSETKQRKWQQNRFCDKTAWIVTNQICHHISHVEKFLHMTNLSPHISTWQICLHIYHVETLLQLTICYVENFSSSQSAKWRKFLHMADIFSTGTACGACDKYEVCFGLNFWLEGPTWGQRFWATYALFRDTPLGHFYRAQSNSQISQTFRWLAILLFG